MEEESNSFNMIHKLLLHLEDNFIALQIQPSIQNWDVNCFVSSFVGIYNFEEIFLLTNLAKVSSKSQPYRKQRKLDKTCRRMY